MTTTKTSILKLNTAFVKYSGGSRRSDMGGGGGHPDPEIWGVGAVIETLRKRGGANLKEPLEGCIFDVISSLNTKFFQIWSSVTGYGELCVCFYPIRIGEIF